jgi:hypothetical protein
MKKTTQAIYLSLMDMQLADVYTFTMQPDNNFYI